MKQVAAERPLPELADFLGAFAHHFHRSEGRDALERYSTGLLSDLPRKNGETIASAVPGTNAQRLQELLTRIQWDEAAFNRQRGGRMRDEVRLGDGVLLLDDTAFVKQGTASVGVARQYCGVVGKVANCQVAVTCVYADPATHWPVNVRLYLPAEWTEDPDRCLKVGVPPEVTFQTKPQIALALLDEARAMQIPHGAVVADAGYGSDPPFLAGLEERQEPYVVAVPCDFRVEVEGEPAWGSRRADVVLQDLPRSKWKTICWREGGKGKLRKKFVALRAWRTLAGQRQQAGWLLGERPARGQTGEWRYYFSTLPPDTPMKRLVELAHRRWPIERFHEDAKGLLGWDAYQGRLWTGFHRHAVIVMLTSSFLVWREWKQRQSKPRPRGRPRAPFSPRPDRRRQSLAQMHRQVVDALWEMAVEQRSRSSQGQESRSSPN